MLTDLVVREKSLTLLQALRAAATISGSGTRSMATRSAIPFLISQPSMSGLLKYSTYFLSNSSSLATLAENFLVAVTLFTTGMALAVWTNVT